MSRQGIRVLLSAIALGVAFLAGAAVSQMRGWGSPLVDVEVINDTGDPLREVRLEFDSCGTKVERSATNVAAHAAVQFHFLPCGEAGYLVTATRLDGTVLSNGGGYAESGYSIVETVQESAIRSKVAPHRI